MKKRTTIRISAFLLCLCCAFFTSCKEDDGKGYVFGYDISSNPGSLDPQYASDRESYLIIGSVFEGLFRIGADGNAEKAMAESYTVSDDGLTYNFKLKQDRYWTDVNGYNNKITLKRQYMKINSPAGNQSAEGIGIFLHKKFR